jgi:hypothetical protein
MTAERSGWLLAVGLCVGLPLALGYWGLALAGAPCDRLELR